MDQRRIRFFYWLFTLPFVAGMLMSSIFYFSGAEAVVEGFGHLGYPPYLMQILGTAKILGVLALLFGGKSLLKEWAYAGFTFNILGAVASHAFSGDDIATTCTPFVILALMGCSYFFWKKAQIKVLRHAHG